MGFKDYLLNNPITQGFQGILQWARNAWDSFRNRVLNSAKIDQQNNAVSFSFSKILPIQEASNIDTGKAIVGQLDTSTWDNKQKTKLKNDINRSFKIIYYILGNYFEISTAIKLIRDYKLSTTEQSIGSIESSLDTYLDKIKQSFSDAKSASIFINFVNAQAAKLAQEMFSITHRKLGCKPSEIYYFVHSIEKSDIKLICSKNKSVDWSVKYSKQPLIKIKELHVAAAYAMLGGKNKKKDSSYYKFLLDTSEDEGEFKEAVFADIKEAIKQGNLTNPVNFTQLLSNLLGYNDNINLAVVDSSKGNITAGRPSDAFNKDFNVTYNQDSIKLAPKRGSLVKVIETQEYIRMNYTAPDGASHGTYLIIELMYRPKKEEYFLMFKVNNLR